MEETIRLWIRDLGFPVTVAGLAIYALYKMFMLREQMAATHSEALNKHATELKSMSEKMGLALTENTGGSPWGSEWGSPWSTGDDPQAFWVSITGEGAAVSVKLRAEAATSDVKWYSTDLLYKPGGLRR